MLFTMPPSSSRRLKSLMVLAGLVAMLVPALPLCFETSTKAPLAPNSRLRFALGGSRHAVAS